MRDLRVGFKDLRLPASSDKAEFDNEPYRTEVNTMAEQPADEDLKKWHRHFAVAANNQAWTLSEHSPEPC